MPYDYTTVGHVTVDVLADGTRQAGGTALYSALQAARLGMRTLIVTRGEAREIEELLAPHAGEIELQVLPAAHTTTLVTAGSGLERAQRVRAWAGELPADLELDTAILHLAPIACETPARWLGRSEFVGLTPQGLARHWQQDSADPAGAPIGLKAPGADAEQVLERCDAVVLSEFERTACAHLIEGATAAGALVAITCGPEPGTLIARDGSETSLPVPVVRDPRDDLGAGDVFAAGFFIALAEGHTASQAGAFANAAAAVRMLGKGAQAIGGREAIEARLRAVAAGS